MNITLNGKKTELTEEMSLIEFLKLKGIEPERVVVEYNYGILKREDWEKTVLKENDNVEVLRFVGGG